MFRKPRITAPPRLIPAGESPFPLVPVPVPVPQTNAVANSDPIQIASSPPSPKRQKMASEPTQTPAKTPGKAIGKPKQSLLTPYAVGNGKKMAFKPATSTGKSGAKKNGNTSILSFFKPSTPTADVKTPAKGSTEGIKATIVVKGEQNDDLFIRHGGYELDLSEPEDEDDGDDSAWSVERTRAGELQLAKGDDDLYSSPVRVKHSRPWPPSADSKEGYELDVAMNEDVMDEIESTAPPRATLPENLPSAGAETLDSKEPESPPKFNPASLKLDGSRSFLFSKKGSTTTPFKSSKQTRSGSFPGSSAEEVDSNDQKDGNIALIDERADRSIGEFVSKRAEDRNSEKVSSKRTREQAFTKTTEAPSDSPMKEGAEDASPLEVEVKLEDCNVTPKARKRDGSAFEEEEYEDIEDFSEEPNFEEQEAFMFDPASRAEAGYEDFDGDLEYFESLPRADEIEDSTPSEAVKCPICAINIGALLENDKNDHVNHCLDGTPIPLPTPQSKSIIFPTPGATNLTSSFFGRAPVITPSSSSSKPSAFTKLMSTNSESQAWASAAKSEVDSRGKKAADRKCPFYKILFNGPVTVDAFRYGAVPGCQAYFLSHFHSDHYIGLSSKWSHGPIYCSRVTANLVRSKLGVDPKYVRELPWEEWADFGVEGIRVRGLDANHCPGSMLFLFEEIKKGGKRILHCGDFRARPEHLRHPLLTPGKEGLKGQKIDVVYLDTTYLNPKYAFPAQDGVIEACATMCVKLQKEAATGIEEPIIGKKSTMGSFMTSANHAPSKKKGRLLIIVGTYSIGKERICLGIAKALGTKIFAPPNKLKICRQIEDPILDNLLTSNPHEAQVHMTPLMDIQIETLQEYLNTFKPHFDRIVGFRPSGWNYRPPNSRLTDSPAVNTVLYGAAWRSEYSTEEMTPMRGSGREVKCFGVPYSEHSSFRELTMFICGLNVVRVVPTVNIGSAKRRDEMKVWIQKWEVEKRKNGLFNVDDGEGKW
ncbi:DNA repair metallo-beta-lactamase-domain-containing protein [Morchella snyderi]|nr:DNA repair metallo-beta-lactamase-domain-containing protein [Morchella snyderi]